MKVCPVCNLEYADSESFCKVDGAKLCVKEYMMCPKCGETYPMDAGFCVSCGVKLISSNAKKKCPKCGKELPMNAEFCISCGASTDTRKLTFHPVYSNLFEMVKIPNKDFEIGKTQVTQELYEAVMGENPSYFPGPRHPVECVSWYEALYFCNKLSVEMGLTPVYSVNGETDVSKWNFKTNVKTKEGRWCREDQWNSAEIKGNISANIHVGGFRLPMASEWDYAAADMKKYDNTNVDNFDSTKVLKCLRKYTTTPPGFYQDVGRTMDVGQREGNAFGLYDMLGNVWEMCYDGFDERTIVIKGCSYKDVDYWTRSHNSRINLTFRNGNNFKDSAVGFRLVRTFTDK